MPIAHNSASSLQIDIVVANYNNGRFLDQLIQSVQSQTSPLWKLYIVDDSSTDESMEILQGISNPKIEVIRHLTNKGAAAAFRTGIQSGNNAIVTILGADDGVTPDFTEKVLFAHQQHKEAALIYFQSYQCNELLEIEQLYPCTKPLNKNLPICDQLYSICNPLTFKRDFYNQTSGMSTTLKKAVDHDLILKLSEVGDISHQSVPLYLYRIHNNGIIQGQNENIAPLYSLLARITAFHRRNSPKSLRKRYYKWSVKYHSNCLVSGHSPESLTWFQHWIRLLKLNPFTALRPSIIKRIFSQQ